MYSGHNTSPVITLPYTFQRIELKRLKWLYQLFRDSAFNSIKPIALSLTSPLWIYRKEAPNNSFLDASLLLRCFLDACNSFDHEVEVNSRLSTITNTSQISLGGARKTFGGAVAPPRTPVATCLRGKRAGHPPYKHPLC